MNSNPIPRVSPASSSNSSRRKYLHTEGFHPNFIPGLCPYKSLYVWLDLHLLDGGRSCNLGWLYWLPNPLFLLIWYLVAVPSNHPELTVDEL